LQQVIDQYSRTNGRLAKTMSHLHIGTSGWSATIGKGCRLPGQLRQPRAGGLGGRLSTWIRQGRAVYCYFDNDQQGHAALDALRLKHMLERS
jgi:uncharacterized protein YecE (DUF72 family)